MTTSHINLTAPEIIKAVSSKNTLEEQIAELKKYNNKNFQWLINLYYNRGNELDGIVVPEYRPSIYPIGNTFSTLARSERYVENAIMFHNREMYSRYENAIIDVLETIHKDEAALLKKVLENDPNVFSNIEEILQNSVLQSHLVSI